MGCILCCSSDDKSKASFNKDRSCTDIIPLAAFIAIWAAIIAIFASAIGAGGDPNKILRGVDWQGRVCGSTSDVKDLKYAVWPQPTEPKIKICAADCNVTSTESYMLIKYESTAFLGAYCVPKKALDVNATSLADPFADSSVAEYAQRAMADLLTAWPVILISVAIALVISLVYGFMVRCCGGFLIWSILLGVLAAGFISSFALLKYAQEAEDSGNAKNRAVAMKVLGALCAVVTFLFALVIFFLRKSIQIAIGVIKASSSAIQSMMTVYLVPLLPLLWGLGFFVWWISITLYIFSVSDKQSTELPFYFKSVAPFSGASNYTQLVWQSGWQGAFALHFFYLLWNVQFLVYLTFTIMAGAAGQWYFAANDASGSGKKVGDAEDELPKSPMLASCWRTLRFHLGTVAIASALIAVLQFIRAWLTYIKKKTESKESTVQKVVFCLCFCCLKCLEKCLDIISRNALVYTAVRGDGFCTAATSSFGLILANLAKVAAVNMVAGFVFLIGKVFICFATAGICALIMASVYKDSLNSLAMPVAVIFILAYLVASLFTMVYEVFADTILLCFLIEAKHNPNGPFRAPRELMEILEQTADHSKRDKDSGAADPKQVTSVENINIKPQ